MKTYARIENDKVVEFLETDGDITQMFAPGFVWVEVDPSKVLMGMQADYNYGDWLFAFPEADMAAILARQDAAIKAQRDRRKVGGVLVAGKWLQTDADSCIQFLGLKDRARDLLAAGGTMTDPIKVLGQTVQWRTLDGSYLAITAQVAFDVVAAKGDLDALAFANAEKHRAALAKAADPAAYDFSAGWPAIYGE